MTRFGGADPSAPGQDPFEPDPGQSTDNLEGREGQPDPDQPGQPARDPKSPDPEDSFTSIDPKTLPPELQPLYKSMQRDYTKGKMETAEVRKVIDAFNRDPYGTLDALARQRGFRLVPFGADPGSPGREDNPPGGGEPPTGKDPLEGLDEDEKYVAGIIHKVVGGELGKINTALQQMRSEGFQRTAQDQHRDLEAILDKGYGAEWVQYEPKIMEILQEISREGKSSPWMRFLTNSRGELDADLLIYKVSGGKLGRHTKRAVEEREELEDALGSSMLPTKGSEGRTVQAGKQAVTVGEAWDQAKAATFRRRR